MFSPELGRFVVLMVVCTKQFLILVKLLDHFSHMVCAYSVIRNFCLSQTPEDFLLCFPLELLPVSLRSIGIFHCGVSRGCGSLFLFFPYGNRVFPSPFV